MRFTPLGAMHRRELNGSPSRFAQADRHVSVLKERIIRQRAVLVRAQQKGHATEAAELLLRTLEESLRGFEKHRQVIFDRLEAKQRSLLSDGAPATHPSVEDVSGSRSLSQTLGFRYSRTSRKGLQ